MESQNSENCTHYHKHADLDIAPMQQNLKERCKNHENAYEHTIESVEEHHYDNRIEYSYNIQGCKKPFVYTFYFGKTFLQNENGPHCKAEERFFVKYDGQKDNDEGFLDDLRAAEGNAGIHGTSHYLVVPSFDTRSEEHILWGGMYQLRTLMVQDFVQRARNEAKNRRNQDPRFQRNPELHKKNIPETIIKTGYSLTGMSAFQQLTNDPNVTEEVCSISASFWELHDYWLEMVLLKDLLEGQYGREYDCSHMELQERQWRVNEFKPKKEVDTLLTRAKKNRDTLVEQMKNTRGRILITMGSEESSPEHLEHAFQVVSEGKGCPVRVTSENIRNAIRNNTSLDGVLINEGDPKHMFIYTMGDKHQEPFWRKLRNRMLHHRLQIIRNIFLPFYDHGLMSEDDWQRMLAA